MNGIAEFNGFSKQLPEFLNALKQNNNKAWFDENRADFDALCIQPSLNFINAMEPRVSAFNPTHKAMAKINGSLRRIYRDTRFSKDKTPYHTYLHLIFWTGENPNKSAGIHVILSPGGFGLGAGHWGFTPDQIKNYRQSLMNAERLSALQKAISKANEGKCYLEGPALKRIPKGFETLESASELIRQKGLIVRTRNENYQEGMFDERCCDIVETRMKKLLPLQIWLLENVYENNN